jgi:hypothetical protein
MLETILIISTATVISATTMISATATTTGNDKKCPGLVAGLHKPPLTWAFLHYEQGAEFRIWFLRSRHCKAPRCAGSGSTALRRLNLPVLRRVF